MPPREGKAVPEGCPRRDGPKCAIGPGRTRLGEHGRIRQKDSEYLLQIREKQKARRIYGVLEKQFEGYYVEAARKSGRTGETAAADPREPPGQRRVPAPGSPRAGTWPASWSRHGHFLVNGKRVNIPSYRVRENDVVEVTAKSLELTPMVVARAEVGERTVPAWLELMPDQMRILVHQLPARAQIDTQVQEQLIVEFYSK